MFEESKKCGTNHSICWHQKGQMSCPTSQCPLLLWLHRPALDKLTLECFHKLRLSTWTWLVYEACCHQILGLDHSQDHEGVTNKAQWPVGLIWDHLKGLSRNLTALSWPSSVLCKRKINTLDLSLRRGVIDW